MNKIIANAKKTFNLLTLIVVLIAASSTVHAAGEPKKHKTGSANTAEVLYIGSPEGHPMFNVVYNNTEGDRFSVSISDEQGYELFQSSYTDKKFDKKFKLADSDTNGKLIFIIRNYKDNSVQTFEIKSNTRMVEDVEVKEVK